MNVRRFTAVSSREALAKARLAFGDATLILSNRPTANGVEVIATTEEMINAVAAEVSQDRGTGTARASQPRPGTAATSAPRSAPTGPAIPSVNVLAATAAEQDADQLAMSTLSFQDYVRERMLRRRHEALHGKSEAPQSLAARAASTAPSSIQRPGNNPAAAALITLTNPAALAKATGAPRAAKAAPQQGASVPRNTTLDVQAQAFQAAPAAMTPSGGMMDELHAMREMIEERFTTMAWLGQTKQDPIQSNLMLKLIRSGYSPSVVRGVLERMPEGMQATDAIRWVMDVLEHNVLTDSNAKPIYVQGGIHALVGATGVGKTTTTAKLAAMCVKTYGAQSVGLITLDTYRIAAHEQLRAYGRMLGVVAHLAHDRAALQDLLGLLANKKMVLIDTTGMAPRDPRTKELLDVLDIPRVNRLLVLNAGSHGDTQDEVFNAYKSPGSNSVVLTKLDETVKLGPALDTVIRHQMVLRGVTRGQRVPEDWEQPNAAELVRSSMRSVGKSPQDPKSGEVGLLFANAGASFKLESAHDD
jgi:flagellar biosynthesis protein FlhF